MLLIFKIVTLFLFYAKQTFFNVFKPHSDLLPDKLWYIESASPPLIKISAGEVGKDLQERNLDISCLMST